MTAAGTASAAVAYEPGMKRGAGLHAISTTEPR